MAEAQSAQQFAQSLAREAYSASRGGFYERALSGYDRAIAAHPGYAWAYAHRAETRVLMHGDIEQIIADFDKAISLKPDYAWAHTFLTRSLEMRADQTRGDMARALWHLDRAFELDPVWLQPPRYHSERGFLHLLDAHLDDAQQDFERALASDPPDRWRRFIRYHQAELTWLRHGASRAATPIAQTRNLMKSTIDRAPDVDEVDEVDEGNSIERPWDILYYVAGLTAMQGNAEDALSWLDRAIRVEERSDRVLFCDSRARASVGLAWARLRGHDRFKQLIAPHPLNHSRCMQLIESAAMAPELKAGERP
ncbi:MAG: hypothetical protein MJE77_11390 [Proteobacteria bacterium]|nr:hypothetical protein [Pseudomonadota bacterium]